MLSKQHDPRNSFSGKRVANFQSAGGWSLLEMAIVLSIILILSSITFVTLQGTLRLGKSNTAYNIALRAMRDARQMAIDDWTTYYVTFVAPNTIQVWQQPRGIVGQPLPPALLKTTYLLPTGAAGVPPAGPAPPEALPRSHVPSSTRVAPLPRIRKSV